MSTFDEMTRSLGDLYQKLAVSGKRAAAVTKLRMELSGHDRERREYYSALGEKINELRRSGQISDAGLLVLLEDEFEKIDRSTRKIQETSDEIKLLNIEQSGTDEGGNIPEEFEQTGDSENLLDSFGVI